MDSFTSVRENNQTLALKLSKPVELDGSYGFGKLLLVEGEGPIKVTGFVFEFTLLEETKVSTTIEVIFETEDSDNKINASLILQPKNH